MTNVQVELEAVRPDGAGQAEEEYRLSVALLPLRLRIDQNIVVFLQEFFAASEADRGTEERSNAEEVAAMTMADQQSEGEILGMPIFQTFQLALSTDKALFALSSDSLPAFALVLSCDLSECQYIYKFDVSN